MPKQIEPSIYNRNHITDLIRLLSFRIYNRYLAVLYFQIVSLKRGGRGLFVRGSKSRRGSLEFAIGAGGQGLFLQSLPGTGASAAASQRFPSEVEPQVSIYCRSAEIKPLPCSYEYKLAAT